MELFRIKQITLVALRASRNPKQLLVVYEQVQNIDDANDSKLCPPVVQHFGVKLYAVNLNPYIEYME